MTYFVKYSKSLWYLVDLVKKYQNTIDEKGRLLFAFSCDRIGNRYKLIFKVKESPNNVLVLNPDFSISRFEIYEKADWSVLGPEYTDNEEVENENLS